MRTAAAPADAGPKKVKSPEPDAGDETVSRGDEAGRKRNLATVSAGQATRFGLVGLSRLSRKTGDENDFQG